MIFKSISLQKHIKLTFEQGKYLWEKCVKVERHRIATALFSFLVLLVYILILHVPFWCVSHPDDCVLPSAVSVQALDVTVSQSSVQVARGQAAVLPCSFTTSAALNNLNIIWMVIPLSNANQPEQVQCSSLMHSFTHIDRTFLEQRHGAKCKGCCKRKRYSWHLNPADDPMWF